MRISGSEPSSGGYIIMPIFDMFSLKNLLNPSIRSDTTNNTAQTSVKFNDELAKF